MRWTRTVFAVGALGLLVAVIWLLWEEPRDAVPQRGTSAAREPSEQSEEGLWSERGGARRSADGALDAETNVARSSAGDAEPMPEPKARELGFGVQARVVDERGSPLHGWPVVLLREDASWGQLAAGNETCEPAKRIRNCGACHSRAELKQINAETGWSPRSSGELFEIDPVAARATSEKPSGEVYFPLQPGDEARFSVRLECVVDLARAIHVVPSDPPACVDLVVARAELVRIRVLDQETWRIRPTVLRPWIGDENAWLAAGSGALALRAGEALDYPIERDAPLRFETWIERAFAPRLHLEPQVTPEGRELALDVRERYARAKIRVLDAEGHPMNGAKLAARLFEPEPSREVTLQADAEGTLRFALGASSSDSRGRGLSIATWPRAESGFALPWETKKALLHPDRNEAHVDLSTPLPTGDEVDLGSIRLGEGPTLLSGRVVDDAGRPVPTAVVLLFDRNETVPCDGAGRFVRRGFPAPSETAINAAAPGYASPSTRRIQLPAAEVELVLHQRTALVMRILGPPELLAMPVTMLLDRPDRASAEELFLYDALAESFDAQGQIRFEGVPAIELLVVLRAGNVVIHEFRHTFGPELNDLGTLDLGALVRPLRFRLEKPAPDHRSARLRALSALKTIVDEAVVFQPPDGTLDLFVPRACDSWQIDLDGQRFAGSVLQMQPILLR